MDGDVATLAPDRFRAGAWTAVGAVTVGLAAWAFSSSTWSWLYAALLTTSAVPTAAFALQLLAPEMWTLRVDQWGVRGHVAAFSVAEPFSGLRAVEVDTVVGEPVLVLLGHTGRRRLLLPVGCELGQLRALLQDLEFHEARGR